jgi:hypothetical protein
MAQAVSHSLSPRRPRVSGQVRPCWMCWQSGKGQVIFEFFSMFPCPPWLSTLIYHLGGWTIGPMVVAVQRHSLTPSTWTTAFSDAVSFENMARNVDEWVQRCATYMIIWHYVMYEMLSTMRHLQTFFHECTCYVWKAKQPYERNTRRRPACIHY